MIEDTILKPAYWGECLSEFKFGLFLKNYTKIYLQKFPKHLAYEKSMHEFGQACQDCICFHRVQLFSFMTFYSVTEESSPFIALLQLFLLCVAIPFLPRLQESNIRALLFA